MSVQSTGRSKDEKRRKRVVDRVLVDPNDPLALVHKAELAALLGVNKWTIDNWRKKGALPPPLVLTPQIVAWRRCVIAQWLEQRQNNPAATLAVRDRKRERRR